MKRMKARVTERGQIMIPKRLQDRLRVFGCLGKRLNTDAVMVAFAGGGLVNLRSLESRSSGERR